MKQPGFSSPLRPVRGTHDLFGEPLRRQQLLYKLSYRLASLYGYQPIETPIFEAASVFDRTLGEISDIIGKETYTFPDRGGELITLRPEGTASIVRAIISNRLAQALPLKFIYSGPMFRYERPQKGRYRQFHHVGVECLGINDPYADVECIALGIEILTQLDISASLELNTIGDLSSRLAYRQALIDYLTPYENDLSPDSQKRLQRNPLRILDSKDPTDRQILLDAPLLDTYLTSEAQNFYEKVQHGLETLGINFQHNPQLVRGLDYYCHTVFEIVHDGLGAQNTLLAGGRYDGLVEQMGGPAVPGLGWALGVERVVSCLQEICTANPPFAMIYVSDQEILPALQLAIKLRRQGRQIELCYGSTIAKRLKQADRLKATLALILGPEELASNEINIKNLATGKQERVSLDQLGVFLAQYN